MTAIIRCQCGWPSAGDTVPAAKLKLEAHQDECPDYRGTNFLKEKNRMSRHKLTLRDLEDSWACKHAHADLSSEERVTEIRTLLDEVRADTWDEALEYVLTGTWTPAYNPYRKQEEA